MGTARRRGAQNTVIEEMAADQGVTIKHLIIDAIEKNGSILSAATSLGVTSTAVRYWLKHEGIVTEIVTRVVTTEAISE